MFSLFYSIKQYLKCQWIIQTTILHERLNWKSNVPVEQTARTVTFSIHYPYEWKMYKVLQTSIILYNDICIFNETLSWLVVRSPANVNLDIAYKSTSTENHVTNRPFKKDTKFSSISTSVSLFRRVFSTTTKASISGSRREPRPCVYSWLFPRCTRCSHRGIRERCSSDGRCSRFRSLVRLHSKITKRWHYYHILIIIMKVL